jgi:hypothetical protein
VLEKPTSLFCSLKRFLKRIRQRVNKTFFSGLIILEILFIVDRVNLVYQQAEAFAEYPELKVGKLHGEIVTKELEEVKVRVVRNTLFNMLEMQYHCCNRPSLN